MKFGLFIDKTAQESFEIKDNKSYLLNSDIPYSTHNSIGNDTHMSIFQYPFLFNNEGYFINLKKSPLPEVNFDIIFLIRERSPEDFPLSKFKKKYPNAKIFGVVKEQWIGIPEEIRCYSLAECDEVIIPFKLPIENQPGFSTSYLEKFINKPLITLHQPYNINYLYNKYYKTKRNYDIFSYISPTKPELRRSHTEEFTNYMSNKYNLSVKRIMTDTWSEFMEEISDCRFIFNLDPMRTAGQTGIQSAILGIPTLGCNGDSNHLLFPELAENDFNMLEKNFINLNNNLEAYIKLINDSFKKVNNIYSMENIKQKIIQLYKK